MRWSALIVAAFGAMDVAGAEAQVEALAQAPAAAAEDEGEGDESDDDNDEEPAPAPAANEPCRAPYQFKQKHRRLQAVLEKRLDTPTFAKYLRKEQLAVAVVDLTKRGRPLYAGVNDDHMYYSASLPKIAILMTVVNAVAEGTLEWTHEFDRRLLNMIVASDNADASWGAELVGLPAIEQLMRDPRYCLYDDKYGGLWVGRSYRGGGPENRDPKFDISHGATARQAVRLYAMLEAGKVVDPHWSFRMMGLMSPPRHHHKFVAGLKDRPGVVFLARKSGSWRHFHSDSALIQHKGRIYAVVGISEVSNGEDLMRQLVRVVDDIVIDGTYRRTRSRGAARR